MNVTSKSITTLLLLFCLAGVAGLFNASHRPALPFPLADTPDGIRVISNPRAGQFQQVSGKFLLAIDRYPVRNRQEAREVVERLAVGDQVSLLFSGGIRIRPFLIRYYAPWQLLLNLLIGLSFFFFGGLIWWKATRPGDRYFAISAFLFGYILMMAWGGMGLSLPFSLPLVLIYFLSYPLAFVSFLIFSLYFPVPVIPAKELATRRTVLLAVGSAISLLLIVFFWRKTFRFSLQTVDQYYSIYRLFRLFILFTLLAALLSMLRNWRQEPNPENRRKIQWVLWGVFWGGFPFLFLQNLPQIFGGAPLIPEWLANLAILLIPASIAVAIWRHRLFDIELVISRSVVYFIVLLSLIAVYLLTVSGISLLVLKKFSLSSPVSSILAALLIALLFQPLRNAVQRLVDRRFFRIKYDRFRALESFITRVKEFHRPEEVLQALQADYHRVVPVERQKILHRSAGEEPPGKETDAFRQFLLAEHQRSPCRILLNETLATRLEQQIPVRRAPLPADYVLFLPVNKDVGWLLGEKSSGARFWKEDLDLAKQMAEAAAGQLEKIGYLQELIRESVEKEKARRLSEWKSLLVAEVAHDLRAPLSTILWKLNNLQRAVGSEENNREAARDIQRQVRRIQNLIQSLLQFSAVEEGRFRLNLAPVNVGESLQEVLDLLSGTISKKQISVRKQVPADLRIRSDGLFFQEILLNLIHNAAKFSPEGESIEIRAAMVTGDRAPEAQIEIEDRAGGMPPAAQPSGSEAAPENGARPADSGLHLGLTIVRQFTELLNGRIQFSSRPGVGTTVTLRFPAIASPDIRRKNL